MGAVPTQTHGVVVVPEPGLGAEGSSGLSAVQLVVNSVAVGKVEVMVLSPPTTVVMVSSKVW